MRSLLVSSACLAFLFAAPPAATAAGQDAATVQQLRRISVTATRGAREIDEIAAPVTVKSAEEIGAELATDIKDLVRYEPGISVANAPGRFGLAGFNIRGIGGNRVLIRIDNVRMADAFDIGSFSDARRNLIDLDAVKSVEIVRGAASALYGSDAIGGVVSFVLKDPADYLIDGRRYHLSARSGFQSDDDGWFTGGTAVFGGERASALLSYTHREGSETENRGNSDAADRTRTKPNPQDYDSDAVLVKLGWNSGDAHRARLTVEADRGEVGTDVLSSVGISGPVNTQSMRGDDRQERLRISLGHTMAAQLAPFDELDWLLYRQESDVKQRTLEQRYALAAGPDTAVLRDRTFTFDQSVWGAELVFRKELPLGGAVHHLTYGADAIRTDTEQMREGVQTSLGTGSTTSNIPPDDFPVRDFPITRTIQAAFFLQDEISFGDGNWLIVPGVRVDRYELDPRPDTIFIEDNPGVAAVDIGTTRTSPKLGVIRTLGEGLSAFAQYARGFRAPPYNDVNIGFTNLAFGYTAIANPDLKPERSEGVEAGLRGSFAAGHFELTGFYNRYDDFIASLMNVGIQDGLLVFQSRNIDEARIHGAELRAGLELSVLSAKLAGWRLKSSVGYARGEDRVSGEPLNSVDPLKAVLGLGYSRSARARGARAPSIWGVELVGTAVDRQSRVDESSGALFVPPGYVTVDLLGYATFGERLRLNAGIFNLADRKYWEWADVRGRSAADATIDRFTRPGINASASVTVKF